MSPWHQCLAAEYTSMAEKVVLNINCSVELSITGQTVTLCTEFWVPNRGTFSMNEFTILSTELCAFTLLVTLWWWWLHFSCRSPKAEGVALLPFKQLQSPRLFPQGVWPWVQAVPQEGLSCSYLALWPGCFPALLSVDFTHGQRAALCLCSILLPFHPSPEKPLAAEFF